jgi:hypothetical protein
VIDQEQVGEDDGDEAADGDQPEPQGHVHRMSSGGDGSGSD